MGMRKADHPSSSSGGPSVLTHPFVPVEEPSAENLWSLFIDAWPCIKHGTNDSAEPTTKMPRQRSSGKGKAKSGHYSGEQEYYYTDQNEGNSGNDYYVDPRNLALDQQPQGYFDVSEGYMTADTPNSGTTGQDFDPYATSSSTTPYTQDFHQTASTSGYDTSVYSDPTNPDLTMGQADLYGQRTSS